MASSSVQRNGGRCKKLALALLFAASLINAGVMAQEEEAAAATVPPVDAEAHIRGDMVPKATEVDEAEDPQVLLFPSVGSLEPTTAAAAEAEEAGDQYDGAAPGELADFAEAPTDGPKVEVETPAPAPARGDGQENKPLLVAQDDVVCVSKEAVQDKNAVNLKLKAASNCEDSKVKIGSVLQELCDDCKLEIYQEDNSDEIIVSGKYVEADVSSMTNKFNNDNIKDKTDVEEAATRWGKNSKLVLVSLLLTGLLLAALLVVGYYLKTHRKNSKGVRLAESFQVDEENQANTLVSVAPLPQEPLDKPSVNGESPPDNGNNSTPTTNGHSAAQADTEM